MSKRMISSDIWSSQSFLRLSDPAKLLWFGLITTADDQGRGHGSAIALKARFFPMSKTSISTIESLCTEIEGENMAIFGNFEGSVYYEIPKWHKWQTIRFPKDSVFPEIAAHVHKTVVEEKRIEEKRIELEQERRTSEKDSPRGSYVDWEQIKEIWNQDIARQLQLPTINGVPEPLRAKVRARLKEHPNLWAELSTEASRGINTWAREKGFIRFRWLMKSSDNLEKFLEGEYRSKEYHDLESRRVQESSQVDLLEAYYREHPGVKRSGSVHCPAEDTSGSEDNAF